MFNLIQISLMKRWNKLILPTYFKEQCEEEKIIYDLAYGKQSNWTTSRGVCDHFKDGDER